MRVILGLRFRLRTLVPEKPAEKSFMSDKSALMQYEEALCLLSDDEFNEILSLAGILGKADVVTIHFFDHGRCWKANADGCSVHPLPFVQDLENLMISCHSATTIIPRIDFNTEYRSHPLVQSEKSIQFFAAFGLKTKSGEIVGLLHLLGRESQILTSGQIRGLESLATLGAECLDRKIAHLEKCS